VEPYKAPEILQCFQCQRIGHTRQTCHNNPRCVKCTEGHLAADCPKKTREAPAKCANCGGDHPANYRGCKTIQAALNRNKKQSTPPKTNNIVPTPKSSTKPTDSSTPKTPVNKKDGNNSNKDSNPTPITTNTGHTQSDTSSSSFKDFCTTMKDLFNLFKDLKHSNLLTKITHALTQYQTAKSTSEKIQIVAEFFFEMIDDGTDE